MQLGIYRHFKGGEYLVIGIAKHSETLEEHVVYIQDNQIWIRPRDMFEETIERDGVRMKRFEFIREA